LNSDKTLEKFNRSQGDDGNDFSALGEACLNDNEESSISILNSWIENDIFSSLEKSTYYVTLSFIEEFKKASENEEF